MDILILTNYKGTWPYIEELCEALSNKDENIFLLDIGEFVFYNFNEKKSNRLYSNRVVDILLKLPKIRRIIKTFILKQYIINGRKFDVANIHYLSPIYAAIIPILKKKCDRIVVVPWGSDVQRIKEKNRKLLSDKIFFKIDYVISPHEGFSKFLLNTYKINHNKIREARFGNKSIERIKSILDNSDKNEIRDYFNLSQDSFIITIGYNASIYQQHLLILKKIKDISQSFSKNIVLFLPMTYRLEEKNYLNEVKVCLEDLNLQYKIFSQMLSDDEVTKLRIISDITINMQTTDGFSSSIREHLMCKNIVILGDWLNYKIFDNYNVFYLKSSINELSSKLEYAINNYQSLKKLAENNFELIEKISSWDNVIFEWIKALKE